MPPRKIIRCLLDYRTCGSRGFFLRIRLYLTFFIFLFDLFSDHKNVNAERRFKDNNMVEVRNKNTYIQTHLNLDNNTPLFCGSRAKTVGDPTRVDSAAVRTCHRMLMWTKEVQTKKRHESLALTRTGQFYRKKLQKPV